MISRRPPPAAWGAGTGIGPPTSVGPGSAFAPVEVR
jgi:hypothetical protein